ncbi:MAG TPA: hypothetical protein VGB79_11640 [Allosphingosinicella sp.]|jgi:hypothetical protein
MPTSAAALAAALLLALQTTPPSPPIGERTTTPQQLLGQAAAGDVMAEIEAQAAAAAAHPLGTAENPVRVGGPEGERGYLARLRCSNGRAPTVGERREAGVGAYGSVVASYAIDCGAAAPGRASIILDMYHEEHREARAPAGFTIIP